ncbi:MAG: ATP-dependent Clp protease proteolytic subunit, partial [Synergistaceae bacterium]|nr:ATP-dependent Clp protease proteolytic subunit [Synergistaceae bacterium]
MKHFNMKRLSMKSLRFVPLLALILMISAGEARAAGAGKIVVAPLSGTVSVQMEQFVGKTITRAELDRASLIIFRLDTPGGLVEATRGITQAILASRVPVVMWVPPGGRAASAGAFMMQAAHVAAMSPGTNIGAAHPVIASGKDVPAGDMKTKVTNDLMAQMRSLTQLRGRNEDVAQQMIQESLSLTAREALRENVVDLVVDDLEALILATSGRIAIVDGRPLKIELLPGAIENVEMTGQE